MYHTKNVEVSGSPRVGVVLDLFPELTIVLGGIRFVEELDTLRIKYSYNVIEGSIEATRIHELETAIGNMIVNYIENHGTDLIYYGGK